MGACKAQQPHFEKLLVVLKFGIGTAQLFSRWKGPNYYVFLPIINNADPCRKWIERELISVNNAQLSTVIKLTLGLTKRKKLNPTLMNR